MGGIAIIGVPLDLGAGRRGVDMGPSAIRYVLSPVAEATEPGDPRARFLTPIKHTCERVAGLVGEALAEGRTPLVLGGDHSVALGTLGGLAAVRGAGAAIWIDAHGDLNTPETSPSGNVLIGARSLDEAERAFLRDGEVAVHTMSDLDRGGMERAVRAALDRAAGAPFVHVSLDLDALDPAVAPGVGTPVRGGLSYREAHLAMELICASGLMTSLEIVEVNPILDRENATAALAVELAASAFGASIL